MESPVKPKFPTGASSWWKLPRHQLSQEQLEARKKYGKEYYAHKKATDPSFSERNKQLCINYKKENREKVNAYKRAYQKANREKANAYKREYRRSNREKVNAYHREYRRANFSKIYKQIRASPSRRLADQMRARIRKAIKTQSGIKSNSTTDLIGCSVDELRSHLEKQFLPWMTWENHGPLWHIDHIRPCSSFNLLDPEEQLKCFHFTNLQPLEAKENIRKSGKLNWKNEQSNPFEMAS